MLTMIKASQQYDGFYWQAYDTHYRVRAAAMGDCTWSRLDTDLFTRFFMGRAKLIYSCSLCDSTTHVTADCVLNEDRKSKRDFAKNPGTPLLKRKAGKSWPSDICAEYNARGVCSFDDWCKFRHMCDQCSGNNGAKQCSVKSQ